MSSLEEEVCEALAEVAPKSESTADPVDEYREPPGLPRTLVVKKKDEASSYVQWSENGTGFIPCGKTYKYLESGVYSIQTINNMATLVKQNLVTDDLVILPDNKSDMVVKEIEEFWNKKDIFTKFGFSHKRGFLLWGPPGSGKTSTVSLVVKKMIERGGLVILGNTYPQTLSWILHGLRQIEPDRPLVIIMEDIDTLIKNFGESETLALLDGESSIGNVVFISTTNYPQNLDGRVKNRPSRFDRVVQIDTPMAEAREIYIRSRNLGISDDEIKKWVAATNGMSIAHIKELIVSVLCFNMDFDESIERLLAMSKNISSDDRASPVGFQKNAFSYRKDHE